MYSACMWTQYLTLPVPLDGMQIRQVTPIQTICDILNQQPSLKKFLIEVYKQLKIYLTVPVVNTGKLPL